MAECELIRKCPFFNQPDIGDLAALAQQLRNTYCLGNNKKCARYQLYKALGMGSVPVMMLPTQHDWAKHIIYDVQCLSH